MRPAVQRPLQFGDAAPARASARLPMKQDAAPPPDPDRPYRILYVTLVSALTSIADKAELLAWVRDNKAAFDVLSTACPARADGLRAIYRQHLANLLPAPIDAAALAPPPVTLPAAELADAILSDGGDG